MDEHVNQKLQINQANKENGQSLVIIALALIGLLAFVGIAVDVGFLFARSSKLQSAVDAAALAAVTELPRGIGAADDNLRIQLADDRVEKPMRSLVFVPSMAVRLAPHMLRSPCATRP